MVFDPRGLSREAAKATPGKAWRGLINQIEVAPGMASQTTSFAHQLTNKGYCFLAASGLVCFLYFCVAKNPSEL